MVSTDAEFPTFVVAYGDEASDPLVLRKVAKFESTSSRKAVTATIDAVVVSRIIW
jgi:hypothetical protein